MKDIQFLKDEKKFDSIPAEIFEDAVEVHTDDFDEGTCISHATDYRFEFTEGIYYFVLKLEVNSLTFEKYYPMNLGANDELYSMLISARAVRLFDTKVDFSVLLRYCFNFDYTCYDDKYHIFNIRVQKESYERAFDDNNALDVAFSSPRIGECILRELRRGHL